MVATGTRVGVNSHDGWCLLSTHGVPSAMQSRYYSHFTDEESGSGRSNKSPKFTVAESVWSSSLSDPRPQVLPSMPHGEKHLV